MSETNRIDKFKTEIDEMALKTASSSRDRAAQIVGLLVMIAAVVLGFVIWSSSTGQSDPRDQTELVVMAGAFVSLAILGAALYITAGLRRFLRYWLLRQLYEGQAHLDTLVDELRPRS